MAKPPDSSPVDPAPAFSPTLIRPENHAAIQTAFREADSAIRTLEQAAETKLQQLLAVSLVGLPQTREAVEYIAGTHSAYGTDRPAIPASDRLDPVLTYATFRRAYRILERADIAYFGFDPGQVVSDRFTGQVTPYGPITSPAQAAGEAAIPKAPAAIPIEQAVEERITMRKREIWWMVFKVTISFVVRLFGDLFQRVGEAVRGALSIKILGKRISLGKFVAWPFLKLAAILYRLANKLEEEAMGLEPKTRPPAPPPTPPPGDGLEDKDGDPLSKDDPDTFDPELDEEAFVRAFRLPSLDTEQYTGSSGQQFLMSAMLVLRSVETYAARPDQHELREALQEFEAARELRRQHNAFHETAAAWGVDSGLGRDAVFSLSRAMGRPATPASTPTRRTFTEAPTGATPPGMSTDADGIDPAFRCEP